MTFNRECRFLKTTEMIINVIEHKTMQGNEPQTGKIKHPCLSEENPEDWVYECPEGCPYFEPRII